MEEILFLVKKLISVFLYPIGWVLLLLIVAMMTLLFNRSRRIAIACVGGNPSGQRESGLQIGVIRSLHPPGISERFVRYRPFPDFFLLP